MPKRKAQSANLRLAAALLTATAALHAQEPQTPPTQPTAPTTQTPTPNPAQPPAAPATTGGTIHGTVKIGTTPLPGVAITATNTLTGKKYATTTDVDGNFAMTIPKTGRYVVKAELAAFAPATSEVRLTADATDQLAAFTLELASRAAQNATAAEATTQRTAAAIASALGRGTQGLALTGDSSLDNASTNAGNQGAALPTLGNLGADSSGASTDSVAVSGQQGQTNALAGISEDDIRQRVQDAIAQNRQNGGQPGGQGDTNAVVSLLGGLLGPGGGGFGGGPGGGPGGGRRGGGGAGGGGGGAFRNFNPAQPHGNVFYQGGNSALNSSTWQQVAPGLPHFRPNPNAYSNRFGVSLAGSPYIPGLIKPDTRQFAFLNLTGQKNLNAFFQSGRVPTMLEHGGDFSQSQQFVNGALQPVALFDPATGLPIAGNNISNRITAQARALLNYYPLPNLVTTDPTAYNYQTIANSGTNNIAINTRYTRSLGPQSSSPFARFQQGGGGGGQGGGRRGGQNPNQPPVLRQSINFGYNYSHSANDIRNIFLPLGGKSASDGNSLNLGYTISYGRLANNASINWNRSNALTRNYFTDTPTNPTAAAGIAVPNQASTFADPRFYNGVPSIGVTNFLGLSNTTPSQSIGQTIAFSDFVSWRHKKHNYRFGGDIRRVHADSIGGSNPLGNFQFSGYATESPDDQKATATGTQDQAVTGSGFADFLLGLPTQTSLQAGLNKIYLRENVYDWYAQDDWRILANVTLNYGLRYEYFAPYTEKNNRLVNLDHNADFTQVAPVQPGQTGPYTSTRFNRSLVNPDYTLYAPRFGFAWSPATNFPQVKFLKNTVIRGGYGINYNTGQEATFARALSFQPPFAAVQTNAVRTAATVGTNNCTTGANPTLTLASGFNCNTTNGTIQNNYSVNPNYRLGQVQVYNLNIQKTIGASIVANIGYNGSKGSSLDIVRAPNHTATTVTTTNAEAFRYEDSIAGAHLSQLLLSLQQRQRKGIALSVTYAYSHSIDNASSIGGGTGTIAQNDKRLDLEEANSSFDQRHLLTGNFLFELPFGPNRAFLNKGGIRAALLDGFSISGNFTFGSGSYFTPQYQSSAAQELAGGTFPLRPDRVFTQPINGAGKLFNYFNTAAFTKPANGFGTASRDSIEGPGTVQTNASLSRTVPLGDTRNFEARVTATNVFNTVQYNNINTIVNSANYGQVTSAAGMRTLTVYARYRF